MLCFYCLNGYTCQSTGAIFIIVSPVIIGALIIGVSWYKILISLQMYSFFVFLSSIYYF